MKIKLLPVEKKIIFPQSKLPNPEISVEYIVAETQKDKIVICDSIRQNIGIQIAISELRRYRDAPRSHAFTHCIGLSDSSEVSEQVRRIGSLFSFVCVFITNGIPCCVSVARPTEQAIGVYDELLTYNKLNPLVARFMGSDKISCNATASYQVVFEDLIVEQTAQSLSALHASNGASQFENVENESSYTEFFTYFSDPLRNTVSTRCIPTYGLSLDELLGSAALQRFGGTVRRMFVYTEKIISYRADKIDLATFVAWHT
jgi:hypothetical protein